jgi:ornithine--oxo-acid transaminase
LPNFTVLKIAPPLIATDAQLDELISAMETVVELMHTSSSFWSDALGIAQRVIASI